MPSAFKFDLVSPERVLISADAEQVLVPGSDGDFAVLAGHAPVISTLRPGIIEAKLAGGKVVRMFVKGGFAEVEPERLTILAEQAMDVASLDAAGVARERKLADDALGAAKDDEARFAATSAIAALQDLTAA